MKFFLNGNWSAGSQTADVKNPFDQSTIDTVPIATLNDVETAVAGAVSGAKTMKALSDFERAKILMRAASIMHERADELSRTITQEAGKTLRESKGEVARAISTLEISAEEAKRIGGEVLPLDGSFRNEGKLGFTMRIPCGVVVAITPFNFPLNLVCHKVGPALAAGNSIIIKPAEETPLSALKLVEILLEAGCPPLAISCLTGPGPIVGAGLCQDQRVRKISFTGSRDVGESICKMAGLKRVTMELGSNSPLVILPDADLKKVADMIAIGGFAYAGQICISAQRIITHIDAHDELIEILAERIPKISSGDPSNPSTQMGPLIRQSDVDRVSSWINEAIDQGAELICGGNQDGAIYSPTVLANTNRSMKVVSRELFGPGVAVLKATDINDAIEQVNDSPYGLSAAVFTQDIDRVMRFAKQVDSGNIHINGGPCWRTDAMPYGGIKESGLGKEGPKYAVEEMTELKAVVIHSNS